MFKVLALALAILAPAAAQDCDVIPAWAKANFCGKGCGCCDDAVALEQLPGKGLNKAELDWAVLKVSKKPSKKAVTTKSTAKVPIAESSATFSKKTVVKGARMLDRWRQDGPLLNIVKPTRKSSKQESVNGVKPVGLYDVSDDDFHKEMMSDIAKSYTLQEFMAEKYPDFDWDDLDAMREGNGWTMGELAIHLYTAEYPNIYRPMNALMRGATSMDDIDDYWQSYMTILKNGLEKHAPFEDVDTWRGVSDCSSLDVLHVGDEGVLPSFTSTSTEKGAAEGFAQGCTLLHFTGGGYDISSYSDFPGEAELLVEEGRVYTIETAEQKCDDYGDCFERFDCVTDGPVDGVDGPTEEADEDTDPTDEDAMCATINDHYGDGVFQEKYCPLCSCCEEPEAVPTSDESCCDCCTEGGSCEGQKCIDGPFNMAYAYGFCSDDAAADPDSYFSCDDAAEVDLTVLKGGKAVISLAAMGSLVAGVSFSAFFLFRKSAGHGASQDFDAEQPSLYTPLAA